MSTARIALTIGIILVLTACGGGDSSRDEELASQTEAAARKADEIAQRLADAPDLEIPDEVTPQQGRRLADILTSFCGALQSTCLERTRRCVQCERSSPKQYCAVLCSEASASCQAADDCRRAFSRMDF